MRFFTKFHFSFRYPLSSHCSQVYPHSQSTRLISSLLRVSFPALCFVSTVLFVLFVLGYWSVASPLVRASLSRLYCHDFFLSSHVTTTFRRSSTPALFSRRCFSPHCITSAPFTLRRASHSKPRNIYLSHTLAIHCKVLHSSRSFIHSCSLIRFLNIRFTAYSVAIRVLVGQKISSRFCRTVMFIRNTYGQVPPSPRILPSAMLDFQIDPFRRTSLA